MKAPKYNILIKNYKEYNSKHKLPNGVEIELPTPAGSEYLQKCQWGRVHDIGEGLKKQNMPLNNGDLILFHHMATDYFTLYEGIQYLNFPAKYVMGRCNGDSPLGEVYGINGWVQINPKIEEEKTNDKGIVTNIKHEVTQKSIVHYHSEVKGIKPADVVEYAWKANYPLWIGATEMQFVQQQWIFAVNGDAFDEWVRVDIQEQSEETTTESGLIVKKKNLAKCKWGKVVSYNGNNKEIKVGDTVYFQKQPKDNIVDGLLYIQSNQIIAKK